MKWPFSRKKQKKEDVPLSPLKGNEPYTWTSSHIEEAKRRGWTNITIHDQDDGPFMKGTVSGTDPKGIGTWYLPKGECIWKEW